MSHEQRITIVSLISSLLINSYLVWVVQAMFVDGTSTAPDGVVIWARAVLVGIVIAVAVIVTALIMITIVNRNAKHSFLVDERDKSIQVNGMGMTMFVTVIGFLTSIAALAYGTSAFIVFNIIYFSFALGSIAGDLIKLMQYRQGY